MPAFSTHYLFAKEMIPIVEEKMHTKLDRNAVMIGAQGPDIFFFHRAFPWQKGKTLRSAGSIMHRSKCGDIVDRFRKHIETQGFSEISQSYIYGFLMHYALDRTCHPYVYFMQNVITDKFKRMNPKSVHNMIEASIDSVMINRIENEDKPRAFNTENTFNFTQDELLIASSVIESASEIVSPIKYSQSDAATAIEDTKAAQKIMNDKNGRKHACLDIAEKIVAPITKNFKISSFLRTDDLENAYKYVNIYNRGWKSPFGGSIRRESFFDLFEKSKSDALDMIIGFEKGLTGFDITRNISFLTGVELK